MKQVNVITTRTEVLDKSFKGQTKGESGKNIKFVVSIGAKDLSENIRTCNILRNIEALMNIRYLALGCVKLRKRVISNLSAIKCMDF